MLLLAILWARTFWLVYIEPWGLFRRVGEDFAHYWAQSRALSSGPPEHIYNAEMLNRYVQLLAEFTTNPAEPLQANPVPYPPLWAWLFTPFTLAWPPFGFALWIGLDLLATAYLSWRMRQFLPGPTRWLCIGLMWTSWPVIFQFGLGQPLGLLASVVGELYLALRGGRDLQAGLWLSLLAFRPQYGILLGALLVWKRRWRAVGGAIAGLAAIFLGSLAVAGWTTLLEYPQALSKNEGGFRGHFGNPVEYMSNWRELVLLAMPAISDEWGLVATALLGVITVLIAASVWRGEWRPTENLFSLRMVVLLVATILANYHSQSYGGMLLALPVVAMLRDANPSRFIQAVLLTGALLPSFVGATSETGQRASRLFTLLVALLFIVLVREVWVRQRVTQSGDQAKPLVGPPEGKHHEPIRIERRFRTSAVRKGSPR